MPSELILVCGNLEQHLDRKSRNLESIYVQLFPASSEIVFSQEGQPRRDLVLGTVRAHLALAFSKAMLALIAFMKHIFPGQSHLQSPVCLIPWQGPWRTF